MSAAPHSIESWSPASWRAYPAAQQPDYADRQALADIEQALALGEPVAAIANCAHLRALAEQVAQGDGFILQGGDCAETLGADPEPTVAALADLFDRLARRLPGPVIRIARIAGQFAKPRTSAIETRDAISLPAYRGDGVNGDAFIAKARAPDPSRMVDAHGQSLVTTALLSRLRADKSPLFASHEALLLPYEQALARRDGDGLWWATSGHMLWVGDRTRQVDGAHVHFLGGIENLIGVKAGPTLGPDELLRLLDRLDPANRPGKIALIGRFGAGQIGERLPPLIRAARREGRNLLWMIDPMHGNSRVEDEIKVRRVEDIWAETRTFFAVARAENVHPAGLHLEMSPDAVTECIGASGPTSATEMAINFQSLCDPRLNAAQAEQLVDMVAGLLVPAHA